MKSKLFAALAALAIISGSTVSARAQDNNEAADKQAQVDSEAPENSEAQDQSQYSNQPQDDSNAQYDNQAEYDRPAQNNTRVQPDAQASQNAQAQNNQDTGASAAGVARISLLHGDVSTQRGDSGDWSTAALNQPVVAGDRVSTSEASRAEVQLDFANTLRVDERTQANVTALSRTQIQIQLARGLANYSVVKDSEADVEIDAPNLSVHPRRGDGNYRITVFSDDRAEVMVRRGEADISTPQGSTHLRSGQMITVTGSGNDTQSQIADAPSRDDFDRWTSDRDNTIRNAQAWTRTNRYYVGSEDLDAHGRWSNVPDYGDVWVPTVASGWAPYRDGRWVWEPYYGWTWVSYEPWGWAPYHYGRWFMYQNSWVWWPGQSYGYRHYRPIWAPAYVSFFGFGGGGFGVGFGWGSVGWLPIGPCDGFNPWWGGYRSRFNVVNIYNVHNVYNYRNGAIPPLRGGNRYSNLRLAWENDRMRHAVSSVDAHDFGRGRVTARPVTREMLREGRMATGNLPVVPTRDSLIAGQRRVAPPSIARGTQSERFFSTNHNLPARGQSFDREAADLHNAIQRDGKFTPIVGNQRSSGGVTNPRSMPQGRVATENSTMVTPNGGLRENRVNPGSGTNRGLDQRSNQNWRRMGGTTQQSDRPGTGSGVSNPGARPERGGGNVDWRRAPSTGAPQGNAGNGSLNSGNPGRVNNPSDRPTKSPAPRGNGNQNQDWRRSDRPSGSVNRGMSSPTEAPASRDRIQRESSAPTQDRGGDWRRMPAQPRSAPVDRPSAGRSSPSVQRDSGNWRQAPDRSRGREASRPQLDMRQPIVTPRRASPGPPSGYPGNGGGYSSPQSAPRGGYGGGYSIPRSAPNGGYSAPRSAPSGGYGGGYSAPRSAPSGGGGRPSGGGGGGHPSGSGGHSGSGRSDGGRGHR